MLSRTPAELTFAINQIGLTDVLTVREDELAAATQLIWERMKLVIEPSAAVSVAGLLNGTLSGSGPVLLIRSGGSAQFPVQRIADESGG